MINREIKKEINQKRPVVFLDRDGTLNVEVGYIKNVEDLNLIDGAAQAIKKLNEANVATILVTNQTGAARGFYPESHIHDLHSRLNVLLAQGNAKLDAVYYCPHLEGAPIAPFGIACQCRKPEIGMVEQAYAEHHDLDRKRSFVVGDKATDIELAKNCGALGVLVTTGYGEAVTKGEYQWNVQPDFQASSIVGAVDWILTEIKKTK
jgi:D-glycero-D-manno-heptose 1,7-bisphosphate phosphatase